MSEILRDSSTPALIQAIEANIAEYFLLFRTWPQIEVHAEPEMLWTITSIPFAIFNSITRARIAPEHVDNVIETVLARCKSRNVPAIWWVGPATLPASLGDTLEVHGFKHDAAMPGMAVALQSLAEDSSVLPGFVIEQVKDIDTLKQWCRTCAAGFEWPDFARDALFDLTRSFGFETEFPSRNYIGWLNGEPVATATLVLGAGVAGIYNVVTLPQARRKGIGAAITLAPLRAARAVGYNIGILQATEMGVGVYRRLGFQELCKINIYEWADEH